MCKLGYSGHDWGEESNLSPIPEQLSDSYKSQLPSKEARSHKGSYKEENTCKYCDKKPKIYKHIRKHEECTHEAIYCEECELKDENKLELKNPIKTTLEANDTPQAILTLKRPGHTGILNYL